MIHALILASTAAVSVAPSPSGQMVVDGYLRTSAGVPVDGPTAVNLCLYADEVGGEPLFCETQGSLPVQKGFFQTRLGAGPGNPLTVAIFADHDELWFGVTVAGKPLPRTHVETDPFAFRALTCDVASSVAGFTPAATGTPGTVLVVGEDGKIPESVIPDTVGKTYSAGAGLKLIGAVFSLDEASVAALAKAACFDSVTELSAALANWDQNASDDLTVGTAFNGDVTGTHNAMKLSCTGCVTQSQLEPALVASIQNQTTTLEAVSNGTMTNALSAVYESELNVPLPESVNGLTSTITVADLGALTSISVDLDLSYADMGDVTVTLSDPTGKSVILVQRDRIGTSLDGTFPTELIPTQSLDSLKGQQVVGTWTLHVFDDVPSFSPPGTLHSWGMTLRAQSAKAITVAGSVEMTGHSLGGLSAPILPADAATKSYVDASGFGGDGSDGPLKVISDTILDLGGATSFVRNYTSIAILGGALSFTNPHPNGTIVILRSQGDVTLTSASAPMLNASGIGAAGGPGGARDGSDQAEGGVMGTSTVASPRGGAGGANVTSKLIDGGTNSIQTEGRATPPTTPHTIYPTTLATKAYLVACGAGGGGGGGGNTSFQTGGAGGRGGGAVIIECGGTWTFTTPKGISVAGHDGTTGEFSGGGSGGGGGGGAGGTFVAVYGAITVNTGTVNVSGGKGGNGRNGPDDSTTRFGGGGGSGGTNLHSGGGGGAGSAGKLGAGGTGGAGGTTGSGSDGGHATGASGGGGGGGSAGASLVGSRSQW